MFVFEILKVDEKLLYSIRNPQGMPLLNTFDVTAVTDFLGDAADKMFSTMKTKEEKIS